MSSPESDGHELVDKLEEVDKEEAAFIAALPKEITAYVRQFRERGVDPKLTFEQYQSLSVEMRAMAEADPRYKLVWLLESYPDPKRRPPGMNAQISNLTRELILKERS